MPKSFDPVRAAAPPETDVVRVMYEGLTEIDARTLEPVPAVAESWSASEDKKDWTFVIRNDAKWSNGESVTADDFVRSWKRAAEMGNAISNPGLFKNIRGFAEIIAADLTESDKGGNAKPDRVKAVSTPVPPPTAKPSPRPTEPAKPLPDTALTGPMNSPEPTVPEKETRGVWAENPRTLKVSLVAADADLPKLFAHPVFRPVPDVGDEAVEGLSAEIVTNGAFRISSVSEDRITLDRAETYWNRDEIKLDTIEFVATETAEKALEIYRAGGVDAVTNADLAPLALKLLAPYEDFRRTTHAALNFYEFNINIAPYDDARVREALSIAVDRSRLADSDLAGAAEPAYALSPFSGANDTKIVEDKMRARELLGEAGYPDGEEFPPVRLLVNRNETQQRVARSIARMWKDALNIDTEVIQVESARFEEIRRSGEFDVLRRNVVYQTTNELAIMDLLVSIEPYTADKKPVDEPKPRQPATDDLLLGGVAGESMIEHLFEGDRQTADFQIMPLYFPVSFSLVKPYILGFEINSLDAPSVTEVMIDNNWQRGKQVSESKF
ncbi:MAG: peptide ABC transporter substrate-binding protein [Blastocatellia bacterium]|nr:peptide ABC transporter substrate-binding protein [Blastocatellia bacterium]